MTLTAARSIAALLLSVHLFAASGCDSNSDKDVDPPKEDISSKADPVDPAPPVDPTDPVDPVDPVDPADPIEPDKEKASSTFGFESAIYAVSENDASITITVNRTGPSAEAASVAYAAVGGDAMAADDYELTAGQLNWQKGETGAKSFTVAILADDVSEEDEIIELELSNPSGGTLGETDLTAVTIKDTDSVACIELEVTRITSHTTLAHPCYNVESDITVSGAAVLTVSPGVTLKFAAGKGLNVESDGQLLAEGTEEQKVVFTGALQAPGYWDGIEIESIAASSLIHVVVEYGGNSSSFNPANVGLSFDGNAIIKHSTIRFSASHGVALDQGESLSAFANNLLTFNEDAPIKIDVNSLGLLDTETTYTGNVNSNGESRDYIWAVGDRVTTSQTWKNLGVHYRFATPSNDVAAVLTIEPGATLVFPKGGRFDVSRSGTLKAIGLEDQPILFTGNEKSPGYWDGIQFTFNNNPNEMDHTIVEYGGAASNSDANVGIFGQNGRLSIKNTVIRHSEHYGLSFYAGAAVDMSTLTVHDNRIAVAMDVNDLGQLDPESDYSGNANDIIYVTGRSITKSQTIPYVRLAYEVPGTTSITISSTLAIEPGVELRFRANGGFDISSTGSLSARGTEEQPITFTGKEKTKGYWNGIEIRSNSQANILDHTIIEYAGATQGLTHALVGFFGSVTNSTVTHSVLRGSLNHGISLTATTTGDVTTGNTFEDIDGEEIRTQQ